MYDEDAVKQYQKTLAESLTSGDIEEDVNATGTALTAVTTKDGGRTSVIPELSLWAACVIVRYLQSSVSPMQLWATFQ